MNRATVRALRISLALPVVVPVALGIVARGVGPEAVEASPSMLQALLTIPMLAFVVAGACYAVFACILGWWIGHTSLRMAIVHCALAPAYFGALVLCLTIVVGAILSDLRGGVLIGITAGLYSLAVGYVYVLIAAVGVWTFSSRGSK